MEQIKRKVKYIVLDIETTGLDAQRDSILEVGAIAVGEGWEELGRLEFQCHFPHDAIRLVDPFVQNMHEQNGLWRKCVNRVGVYQTKSGADHALSMWLLDMGIQPGEAVLAGRGPHFDQRFILAQYPQSASLLSHRVHDLNTVRRALQDAGILGPDHKKDLPHRAMADCEAELAEAREMHQALVDLRFPAVAFDRDVLPPGIKHAAPAFGIPVDTSDGTPV